MIADRTLAEGEQAAVLAFLADPASYPERPPRVEAIETHMSRVFLAGDRVYKLKKPIRLSFVDFSTLEARRRNCDREFALNQELAPGVYLGVVPLVRARDGKLTIDGDGATVEWLLVMRRLRRDRLLNEVIAQGDLKAADIDRLCDVLASFYARTPRIECSPAALIAWWNDSIDLVEKSLTDPLFNLPTADVARLVAALRQFIGHDSSLILARLAAGRILDGHGDLRPEHVHLGPQILLIDRLEFDDRLRWTDPFDEVGFLALECEMLGAKWAGELLVHGLCKRLGETPPIRLLRFYRCYRAALRARLSIEHLRDPAPRTPERWPRQARAYLGLALGALPDQS